jgi:hypothetical protein
MHNEKRSFDFYLMGIIQETIIETNTYDLE